MDDDKVKKEIWKKEEEIILLKAAEILNTKGKMAQDYFNSFLKILTCVTKKTPYFDSQMTGLEIGSNGILKVNGFVRFDSKKNRNTT